MVNMQKTPKASLWALCAFLSSALLCITLLNIWGLGLFGTAIDYGRFGNWSDAISGIGTLSAVIIALAGLHRERSVQRAAEERRSIEMETAVFQWLTSKEVRDDSDKPIGRLWDIRIQNSTAAPIYHWNIILSSPLDHLCNYQKRPLLPGENVFNLPSLDNLEPSKAPEPTLSFQGISGRTWTRSARGLLQQNQSHLLDCVHASAENRDD